MKKANVKKERRMKSGEVFVRLKTAQKLLYVLWPVILITLLAQNFTALLKLGNNKMDSISNEVTLNMEKNFRDYLLPVETLINGVTTNLNQMLDDGEGYDEFEDYLVSQTDMLTGDFAKDSTGLYGYINGRYIDGAMWVPPEDYVPQQRDWYIDTIAGGGRITYVAPYIDAQSGDSSVTVSRTLKDGKSVIALDLKTTSLQSIIDTMMAEMTSDGLDDSEKQGLKQAVGKYIMILDRSGKIVVHSEPSYSGINILDAEEEPLKSIAGKVLKNGEVRFEIKYPGNHDSFTVIALNDDWYAIAAVDYYDTFGSIILGIIYTIILSAIVILVLTFALFKAASNAMMAEDDRSNTGALAGIYSAVFKIYPYLDKYERLLGTSEKIDRLVPQKSDEAQKTFYDKLAITTNGENMDKLREFIDMSTLDERLKDTDTITFEYLNPDNKWCRERFITAERDESGKLFSVMWVVELIDDEKRSREEILKHSKEMEEAWSEAEKSRQEAEKARQDAENANKAKTHFLASMSHEIRTPINAVLGLDTMILRESSEEQIKKYALNIQNAGQSLLAIINDILDLSKIESGKMEIIPVDYDMASLINDVSNMIMPKAEAKSLEFNMSISPDIPSRLHGDDVRIRQILINLLTNAVKYTEKGSVTLTVTSESFSDEVRISYSVKDTGSGIAKEDLAKLFEEFVRIDEKKNRNIEGTGLGISIVSNLLKLMGSTLEVESVYGEGSNFHFTVTQKIVNSEPIGDLEKRIRDRAVEYNYETAFTIPDADILVVDDSDMNRYVFKKLLKDLQCRIDEAGSGKKCLEMVQEKKYDIIFMDHMMPEMDGIETLHKLRDIKDSPNIDTPVVILTANAITGAKEQYLAEGFDDFLTKPVDSEKLEKLIGELISGDRKKGAPAESAEDGPKDVKAADSGKNQNDELPMIEGVDWDYALLKLKKVELLKNLVSDFALTADSELNTLKSMYESILKEGSNEAYNEYRIRVHAMKNTSAMCGGLQVSALAKTLESAARDIDRDTLTSVMPVFEREWTKLKELFEANFGSAVSGNAGPGGGQDGTEEKEAIDRDLLIQYLDNLAAAMDNVDTDTADAVMDELALYSFDEDESKLIRELAVAVKNLDSTETAKIIERLKAAH